MKLAFNKTFASIYLALLFLAPPLLGVAAGEGPAPGKKEFSKVIKKEFDISAYGTTSLTNKYGAVDVQTWDRDRVKISVTILVNARNESAAEDVFKRIDVQFSNSSDYVSAETVIESKKSSWFGSWSDNDDAEFSINYEVFLPPTNNLRLANKYGNTTVAALEGKGDIQVKYGNFEIDGLGDDSQISLGYGKGLLRQAGDVQTMVSYSRLTLEDVKDVSMESKYSNITISRAGDVAADSKYDNYQLG